MPGRVFDTNVLVSIASGDAAKAAVAVAVAVIGQGGVVSVQVLNDVTNLARRKMRLNWQETREFLSLLRGLLTVQPMTVSIHDAGLALAERYTLSIYDAMIVASALDAACETLWSEDMQHGMVFADRLRIVNPFRER